MLRTLAVGLLSLTLAGCRPLTSATPMAVTTTAAPTTSAAVSLVTRATPSPARTPVSPVDLPPPAISYVGLVSLTRGPVVPITVQRGKYVLLPGSRQIRLSISRDFGSCDTFLSASSNGRWLAYTTTKGDLHVIDTRIRNEYSLGPGCDPTWGPGDRLAYLVATTASLSDESYRGVLVVRKTPLAGGTAWVRGQVWPLGWAAGQLVYGNQSKTFPLNSMLITTGPGKARRVPHLALPATWPHLVAVRPDGGRILVQVSRTVGGSGRTYLDLVDTKTLRVLSEIMPRGFEGLADGAWVGNRIVAGQGYADGQSAHPQPALIRLGVAGDKLRIEKVRNLDPHSDGLFDGLSGLTATSTSTVVATHYRMVHPELIGCRVATLVCQTILTLPPPSTK